jgi:hypothetical protein
MGTFCGDDDIAKHGFYFRKKGIYFFWSVHDLDDELVIVSQGPTVLFEDDAAHPEAFEAPQDGGTGKTALTSFFDENFE